MKELHTCARAGQIYLIFDGNLHGRHIHIHARVYMQNQRLLCFCVRFIIVSKDRINGHERKILHLISYSFPSPSPSLSPYPVHLTTWERELTCIDCFVVRSVNYYSRLFQRVHLHRT